MSIPEFSPQTESLIPVLHPGSHAPRLSLSPGATDAAYPFALIDDSAPFSRIIHGSFCTAGGSLLKELFLVVGRDQFKLKEPVFSTLANPDVEQCWQNIFAPPGAAAADGEVIQLGAGSVSGQLKIYSPLLFCREKQLFIPLVCPSCGKELELCRDDGLLQQKGLNPYSSSLRRYLYCSSCCSSGATEFFVREREDADPLFLSDCRDLVDRFRLLAGREDLSSALPCVSCHERGVCFGPAASVRSRLLPFSFYPFHLLAVPAPTLHVLDFTALISGASCHELLNEIDQRLFPGRAAALAALEKRGAVTWTNFRQEDRRGFSELLFLKLSLIDDVLGRVEEGSLLPPQGDNVWVALPRIGRNLPLGWNFRLCCMDDLTPLPATHDLEKNRSLAIARSALFLFQLLLGNRTARSGLVEAVGQYCAEKGKSAARTEGEEGSPLTALCVPSHIFRNVAPVSLSQKQQNQWERACAAGFALLDAARGTGSPGFREIHAGISGLLEEVREGLFTSVSIETPPALHPPVEEADEKDNEQDNAAICRVLGSMIESCRLELREKPLLPLDDRSDEIVETVILHSGAAPEPLLKAEPSASEEDVATVILSSPSPQQEKRAERPPVESEHELQETVMMAPRHAPQPMVELPRPTDQPPVSPAPPPLQGKEEEDDLAETVMIIPAPGRNRPGGFR